MAKQINEVFNEFVEQFDSQSDEYKRGATEALRMVVKCGHIGFGGDVTDFADWIEEGMKDGDE